MEQQLSPKLYGSLVCEGGSLPFKSSNNTGVVIEFVDPGVVPVTKELEDLLETLAVVLQLGGELGESKSAFVAILPKECFVAGKADNEFIPLEFQPQRVILFVVLDWLLHHQ